MNLAQILMKILLIIQKIKSTRKTINLFNDLLNEINFSNSVKKYFKGDKINETESRSVLHTALRAKETEEIFVDGENITPEILLSREKNDGFFRSSNFW